MLYNTNVPEMKRHAFYLHASDPLLRHEWQERNSTRQQRNWFEMSTISAV